MKGNNFKSTFDRVSYCNIFLFLPMLWFVVQQMMFFFFVCQVKRHIFLHWFPGFRYLQMLLKFVGNHFACGCLLAKRYFVIIHKENSAEVRFEIGKKSKVTLPCYKAMEIMEISECQLQL